MQAVTALKKLNVPYLVSLPLVFQTTEEWLDSELGVHPVQVALQVPRTWRSLSRAEQSTSPDVKLSIASALLDDHRKVAWASAARWCAVQLALTRH